ncbi:MAG: hypothetical protein LUG93_00160 [Lachnospiraceae bacterium]|nr:hypothetical protein [Lachnospiraceae bacterium]
MFQFLYIFGPAAITFLVIQKLSDRSEPSVVRIVIEMIFYALIDAALTTLLLYPIGRVELVFNSEGIRNIRYGITAFFLSMVFAVVTGVILVALEKRLHVELQVERIEESSGQSGTKGPHSTDKQCNTEESSDTDMPCSAEE